MTEEATSGAFSAISDEATRLLQLGLSEDVDASLELIISICRYQTDVRNEGERERTERAVRPQD
jgi:hypothetical protein